MAQVSIVAQINGGTGRLGLDPTLVTCPECLGSCVFVDGDDSWECRSCRGAGKVAAVKPYNAIAERVKAAEMSPQEWETEFWEGN